MLRRILPTICVAAVMGVLPIVASPSFADGDCGTPNGGKVIVFSRVGVDGVGGNPTYNTGVGCASLTYTSDGADLYGVDTRLIYPGANQIKMRYYGGSHAPASGYVRGLGYDRGIVLTAIPSTVPDGSPTYDSAWLPLDPTASGSFVASAADASTTYDTVTAYQCSEAFVRWRDDATGEVMISAGRPCGSAL